MIAMQAETSLLLGALRVVSGLIFVVVVPLLLISSSVRMLVLDAGWYASAFVRHGGVAATGLSPDQLREVGQAFVDYFQSPPGRMDVQVEMGGERRPLFNEREIKHMEDVQHLVFLVFRVQELSAAYALFFVLVTLATGRETFWRTIASWTLAGAALTLAIVAVLGVLTLVDFQSLFVRFHLISFTNDLWILDPRTDYLIRLMPLGFFIEATLRLALTTVAGAIVLGAAALGILRWVR